MFLQFLIVLEGAMKKHPSTSNLILRPKQAKALESVYCGKDVFINFRTGYGKSVVFILARDIVGLVRGISNPICLIVSPLNSLISDQANKLKNEGFNVGVMTVKKLEEPIGMPAAIGSESEESDDVGRTDLDDTMTIRNGKPVDPRLQVDNWSMIETGQVDYLFAHPEAITSRHLGRKLLDKDVYKKKVAVLAIDEAHCIVTWGPAFRKDYSNLSVLNAFIPNVLKIVATATAPKSYCQDIIKSLEMDGATDIFITNPDGEHQVCGSVS